MFSNGGRWRRVELQVYFILMLLLFQRLRAADHTVQAIVPRQGFGLVM